RSGRAGRSARTVAVRAAGSSSTGLHRAASRILWAWGCSRDRFAASFVHGTRGGIVRGPVTEREGEDRRERGVTDHVVGGGDDRLPARDTRERDERVRRGRGLEVGDAVTDEEYGAWQLIMPRIEQTPLPTRARERRCRI